MRGWYASLSRCVTTINLLFFARAHNQPPYPQLNPFRFWRKSRMATKKEWSASRLFLWATVRIEIFVQKQPTLFAQSAETRKILCAHQFLFEKNLRRLDWAKSLSNVVVVWRLFPWKSSSAWSPTDSRLDYPFAQFKHHFLFEKNLRRLDWVKSLSNVVVVCDFFRESRGGGTTDRQSSWLVFYENMGVCWGT